MCRPISLPAIAVVGDESVPVGSELYNLHANRLSIICPVIGNLARHVAQVVHYNVTSTAAIRNLWRAIKHSVDHYESTLPLRQTPLPAVAVAQPQTSAGVHYGSSKIRERPQYPHLKESKKFHSVQDVPASDSTTCNKFYSDYIKPRRTGGIMAIWCRHAIAMGFHCIPSAEGRDDVFSALFCYWPTPPRVVVYDFACQLASYCLAREPTFFADTLFVVDELHQHGHSQCTPSSWLSTYMANDPTLRHLNSSAAECGNAGLGRIKKSVAYATAPHAVAITKHFLSLWNRQKIRELTHVAS
ncbi:hypothetical protein OC846_002580 [Tilletia horrida]|uniref:Uncharacterized protein n=1 Tax=Tilletia horrida TaxID=155126 RepID=A0AAN6JYT3_9BASI|nr:hypothetical protein OC846_002580 [Tilletia horrida]KAK0567720.1 hypothetical protein OC861_002576 [Tilletia horrida]